MTAYMWLHEDPRENAQDNSFEFSTGDGDLFILIAKVGGGSPGKRYAGEWLYRVRSTQDGSLIENGVSSYRTPVTHERVWRDVLEAFSDEI